MYALMVAMGLLVASGVTALACARSARLACTVGALGTTGAALIGLVPALQVLLGASSDQGFSFPWLTTAGGSFTVALDALSAMFLIPLLSVGGLAGLYGSSYMLGYAGKKNVGLAWLFFNVLLASMVLIVVARNGILFLIAWETMALTSYFLVTYENEQEAVCRAGWIYLVATHLATGVLFALFVLLRGSGPSLDFSAYAASGIHSGLFADLLFLMALVGFGTKAGLVPLHVWLPEAHPVAPSHVSAVLSAVMTKMGIYGLLRMLQFLGAPAWWWGPFLMILGLTGGVVGIALALSQRDLKRALAYSTVENVGLITLGLGIGLWGWFSGHPLVSVLGFAGALLHVWNHSIMKGLMFLASGSVLHGAGTRDIEKLGGLLKKMPWTGTAMVLGAVAISALPPMNGFVSEWLLYLGLLKGGLFQSAWAVLLAVGMLAFVGGLAAICFVRLAGLVLLGQERTASASHCHESPPAMILAMVVLAALCVAIGLAPQLVLGALWRPLQEVLGKPAAEIQEVLAGGGISLEMLGLINIAIWLALGAATVVLLLLCRRNGVADSSTWGCGYARPTPRMQYTGRSFAEFMSEAIMPRALGPRVTPAVPTALFPEAERFSSTSPDPIKEGIFKPFFRQVANRCSHLWWLQHGKLNIYLVYLLLLVVLGLGWVYLRDGWM